MTYPDKTVYPVASCNDKDFAESDGCVYGRCPSTRIFTMSPEIFKQEGWHYELGE